MKDFLKFTLASVLGVCLAGLLFFFVGIVFLLGMAVFSSSQPATPNHSVLVLTLENQIPEKTESDFLAGSANLLGLPWASALGLNDMLSAIESASDDPAIDGIYIHTGYLVSADLSALAEIRQALLEFQHSGKFVLSYSEDYTQKGYYVSSAASEVYLHPAGGLTLHGISSEVLFYKDALDKLGVEVQVIRHGSFKSAVEPFVSDHMSDENRLQTQRYISSLWTCMLNEIAQQRRVSPEALQTDIEQMKTRLPEDVLQSGLVDSLFYKDQIINRFINLTGVEKEKDLTFVPIDQYFLSLPEEFPTQAQSQIAIVYAEGLIDVGRDLGSDVISSDGMSAIFRELRNDSTVKAVVFRINSGGGSALASDVIWREVYLTAQEKPVVASFGAMAASGGYYIAAPATYIVASPYTLTGSIGVFGMIPNAQSLMEKKLGVKLETVESNRNAQGTNVLQPMNAEQLALMQKEIEQTYTTFLNHVAEGRNLPIDSVASIAEGRVWSAPDALANGLVDAIGSMDDAILQAAELAQLSSYEITIRPEPMGMWDVLFPAWSVRIAQKFNQSRTYSYFREVEGLMQQKGVQARIPYHISLY